MSWESKFVSRKTNYDSQLTKKKRTELPLYPLFQIL